MSKVKLLQGNEACVEGALVAGLRFFAGYPITPSTEIAELLAERLPQVGGKFIQMEDEIAGMAATIGAALTGLKAMTATSGPGFSLKQENIGFAVMAEVPCVVVNVMRGGPSTGLPTMTAQGDVMQARWGTHGDHAIIALAPWSVSDTLYTTIRAFNLAEKYRTPVIILLDEVIGHMRERVELPDRVEGILERKQPSVPPEAYLPHKATAAGVPEMAAFGTGYRYHVTGLAHDFTGFPTNDNQQVAFLLQRLRDKIRLNKDDIIEVDEISLEDADIMVVAYGSVSRSAARAIRTARESGIKAGLLRLKTIWPFADDHIRAHAEQVKAVIVAEQNQGQLVREVERVVANRAAVFSVNRYDGELMKPVQILNKIKEVQENVR